MISDAFSSLEALRSGHADLLQSISDAEQSLTEPEIDRIRDFLRRAAAAGRVLDTPADRKQAQGLLDYWSATLYSQGQRQQPGSAGVERLPKEETVLAEFETGTIGEIARAAEAWFRNVPPGDRDLVRRILLRLVRLPAEGRKFQATVVPRSAPEQLGPPAKVTAILDGLAGAGLIRIEKAEKPEDDRISLRFDALARSWAPYAGWVDQRVRFRDAASFWDASHQDRTALISDNLLDDALDYQDKNELELKFVAASRDREKSQTRKYRFAVSILAVVAICAVASAIMAFRQRQSAARSAEEATTSRDLADMMRRRAENEKKNAEDAATRATRAAAALQAKVKLSNMVTVTRTLAEIGTAVSDAERQIAMKRIEILAINLGGDPDFAPIFQGPAGELARAKQGDASVKDLERIAFRALAAGRKLKGTALQVQDPDLLKELKAQRAVSYLMARFCAEQIVASFKAHPFTEADPYVKEFWLLYWGELGIVEGPAVESAMVHFGKKLKEIDKKMEDQLPDAKHLLDPQQWKSYSSQQLREKLHTLRSAKLNIGNAAGFLTEFTSHRVPKGLVEELTRILDKELIPAIERELNAEIAPDHKPPADY
jgi:hypothetical protein